MAKKKIETSADDMTPVMLPVEVAVSAAQGLNLRAAPSMDAAVLAVLPKGAGMFVDSNQLPADGTILPWLAVTTGKLSGYVDSKYLEEVT